MALDPAKATRVDVKETVLTDFFARVIVTPEDRINLQDLLKPSAKAAAPALADATKKIAAEARPELATAPKGTQTVAVTAAAASTAPDSRAPVVNFGPLSLINGKVLFSDRLIKPNYTADHDPQFSLGLVIVNVIVKAVTVPFSLLANASAWTPSETASNARAWANGCAPKNAA